MCVRDCENVCLCARAFLRAYCEVLQAVLANKEISPFSFTFIPATYFEGCCSLFCLCATCCQIHVCVCVFSRQKLCVGSTQLSDVQVNLERCAAAVERMWS